MLNCIVPESIYSSPTVRDFSNSLLSPITLEISISLIHLYKCFGLRDSPTPPRKFQFLLSGDYQYFLELPIRTIGVCNSHELVLGCLGLGVEFVCWEL